MILKKWKLISILCGVSGLIFITTAVIIMMFSNKEYVVAFNTDGGSIIEKQIVKKGDKVTKPNDPTKENYTFVKWNYLSEEYDFSKEVTSDMILDALWEEVAQKFSVTFKIDDKEQVVETSKITDDILQSLNFEKKDGYIIKWYLNDQEFDLASKIEEDVILIGKYEKITTFTIKFNTDGGSTIENQIIKVGDKIEEPTSVTKKGYLFDGWYYNNQKYNFDDVPTKDMELLAKWKEDSSIKRFTIKFNTDGGSNVADQIVMDGDKVIKPTNPKKNEYKFKEWQLNGTAYDFETAVKDNFTLNAVWEELSKYNVTFNSDGGSDVLSQLIVENNKVQIPNNPTKDGFTFVEWRLDGVKYNFDTPVTKEITLVAYWNKNLSQDETNLNTMLDNISYSNIRIESGTTNVTSQITMVSGCSLNVNNFPSSIERGTSNTTISLNIDVTCGSENSTTSHNATIVKSPYTYSKIMNSNMLNYDVTINGGSWLGDAKIFLGTSGGFNVVERHAVVEINKIEDNPMFKLRFNNDTTTIYDVPFN